MGDLGIDGLTESQYVPKTENELIQLVKNKLKNIREFKPPTAMANFRITASRANFSELINVS